MEAMKTAILALTPAETHVSMEGYAVNASGTGVALCTAVADVPLGVILDGEPTTGKSSIAICGGNCGPVKVKLAATPGTIVLGSFLTVTTSGTATLDTGSGARTRFARALEAGSGGELILAQLIAPVYSGS